MTEPRWLSLEIVQTWEPLAEAIDVSRVARSPRGFLSAYRRARGRRSRLSPEWRARRAAFVSRHVAQAQARGERWWTPEGMPTRRHLALIMWAFSPTRLK